MDYQVGYVWSDGKIITQSLGLIVRGTSGSQVTETQINIDSKYVYEEGCNSPYGVMLNNSEYLLVKNAQGDVTAVVDSRNGETLVEYEYDPWGQVTSTYCGSNDDETAKNLIMLMVNAVCPLTYRGYNYDFTTGLYYLQSRYYNPEWGRFLNVDDVKILSTSAGDPLAANPYLYCSNNPINCVDYTGYFKGEDHYRYTYTFAISLFGVKYAGIMAQGSLDVDTIHPPTKHFYDKYEQSFHFNINTDGQTDSRDERTSELCEKAWEYVEWAVYYKNKNMDLYRTHLEYAFYLFGQAIHPQQDKIAHSGQTGDIKIGPGNFNFHMHLLDDDNPNGLYWHPIFKIEIRKEEAALINTWFYEIVIWSGLRDRGIYL